MIVAGLALTAAASACAQDAAVGVPHLTPERPIEAVLDVDLDTLAFFSIEVPPKSVLWRASLTCRRTDLDLLCGRGAIPSPEDAWEEALLGAQEATGVERLQVDRLTDPEIAPGTWWIAVDCPFADELPTTDTRGRPLPKPNEVPFRLELEIFAPRTDAVLAPGTSVRTDIGPDCGGFRTFRIEVPQDARVLRFDVLGASQDLDLYARRRYPMTSLSNATHWAARMWGNETLIISEQSSPRLRPGAWFVDVVDPLWTPFSSEFEVLVTFDHDPPARLLAFPEMPRSRGDGPLARALTAVVELLSEFGGGGSGCILTEDGLILTNAHVVAGLDDQPLEEVVVCLSTDPRAPPQEVLRARVVEFDMERDLALLRPTTGFYGQPIPPELRFPTVAMGDPEALHIGDPLWVVGYPSLGGSGSRVSVHASRGILSGYDRLAIGTTFKTDAEISPGNSGGAALDARGRLIGLPSATISDGYQEIGLIHPLWLLPTEWRERQRIPAAD